MRCATPPCARTSTQARRRRRPSPTPAAGWDEPVTRREVFEKLLLDSAGRPRFTQDSPVFADVWLKYLDDGPDKRQDLLLEPHHRAPVGRLAKDVHERLGDVQADHRMAYAGEYVAVQLTLRELLADVLPLSKWW